MGRKIRKANLLVDLSFCGCQDSNLEQYIDRMCQINIKMLVMAHPLANGLAHLLSAGARTRTWSLLVRSQTLYPVGLHPLD